MAELTTVISQPRVRKEPKDMVTYIRRLDPTSVSGWSVEEVVEKYLKPIGMEYLAQAFIGSQINGRNLLALNEHQVIQLGCHATGDRMLFMEYLQIIKKKCDDPNNQKPIAALWTGRTPVEGCAYHQDCCHCCGFVCCIYCTRKTKWEVTKEGIKWTKRLADCQCCGIEEIKFIDYKNLRNVELHKYRYCCSPGQQLILRADAIQTIQPRAKRNVTATPEVSIRHPDVEQAESIIRASWTGANYAAH